MVRFHGYPSGSIRFEVRFSALDALSGLILSDLALKPSRKRGKSNPQDHCQTFPFPGQRYTTTQTGGTFVGMFTATPRHGRMNGFLLHHHLLHRSFRLWKAFRFLPSQLPSGTNCHIFTSLCARAKRLIMRPKKGDQIQNLGPRESECGALGYALAIVSLSRGLHTLTHTHTQIGQTVINCAECDLVCGKTEEGVL